MPKVTLAKPPLVISTAGFLCQQLATPIHYKLILQCTQTFKGSDIRTQTFKGSDITLKGSDISAQDSDMYPDFKGFLYKPRLSRVLI